MTRLPVLAAAMWLLALPAAALELVMVEQTGCHWCAVWNKEIGPIYAKTDEGKAAPLRRVDLHKPLPPDLEIASRPQFTPTFILIKDGVEFDRVEGYPGEDFFWPMVARMIARARAATTVGGDTQ